MSPPDETQVTITASGHIDVVLSAADFELASQLGQQRTAEAVQAHRPGRAGARPNNLAQDINGAAAEIAFARAIGADISQSNTPDQGPDVAGYHVRSTDWPQGKLIVRPGESLDNHYVLVVGFGLTWRIVGSIRGREAMQSNFRSRLQNGRPDCFMVPQTALRPILPRGSNA
jgi:hypothetical protein